MLKIIQITDCHLVPEGGRLFESDPAARLAACIDSILAEHSDAALAVLTGDLAHDGEAEAYALLRRELSRLPMPWRVLPGNHDDRAAMRAAFPETGTGEFLQSVLDTPAGRLVFLDTLDPGVHSGAFCAARRAWLAERLSEAEGRPAYLFMHHPPMAIGMPRLDQYGLAESEAFHAVLAAHGGVRHVFFGHVHRPVSGSWRGIPVSAVRGTNHQNWLDLGAGRENISSLEPPAYAVILIGAESVLVHLHDFLDRSPRFVYDPDAAPGEQVRRIGA